MVEGAESFLKYKQSTNFYLVVAAFQSITDSSLNRLAHLYNLLLKLGYRTHRQPYSNCFLKKVVRDGHVGDREMR